MKHYRRFIHIAGWFPTFIWLIIAVAYIVHLDTPLPQPCSSMAWPGHQTTKPFRGRRDKAGRPLSLLDSQQCDRLQFNRRINDNQRWLTINPVLGGGIFVFILQNVNAFLASSFLSNVSIVQLPCTCTSPVFSILPARGYGCALAAGWARCAWRSRGDARLGSGAWWDGGMKFRSRRWS